MARRPNGYLLEQFLHPHSNRRTDAYQGNSLGPRNERNQRQAYKPRAASNSAIPAATC